MNGRTSKQAPTKLTSGQLARAWEQHPPTLQFEDKTSCLQYQLNVYSRFFADHGMYEREGVASEARAQTNMSGTLLPNKCDLFDNHTNNVGISVIVYAFGNHAEEAPTNARTVKINAFQDAVACPFQLLPWCAVANFSDRWKTLVQRDKMIYLLKNLKKSESKGDLLNHLIFIITQFSKNAQK